MPNIDADNGDFSLPTIPEYVQGGLPSGLTNSSHVFGDTLRLQPRHGQFRSNHRFLGGPYQGWFRLAADAGNLLEEVDEIVIRVCPRGDTSAVEVCKALCAASRPTAWALNVLRLGPSAPAGALSVLLRDHGDAGGHKDGGLIALLDA
jgi:hypothetical protein